MKYLQTDSVLSYSKQCDVSGLAVQPFAPLFHARFDRPITRMLESGEDTE
jgi:hypothetical protein